MSLSPTSLIGRLLHHASSRPDHCAVRRAGLSLTYAELAQQVLALADGLRQQGVTADSVVGIRCEDDARHLLLSLAAVRLGSACCSLPTHDAAALNEAMAARCGVTHVLGNARPASGEPVTVAGSETADSPPARLLFATSGTTGAAKIVVLADADLVAQAARHIASPDERFACLATMEHNFARRHRLYCVAQGATNVLIDSRAGDLVAQLQQLDVSVLHLSAFQAQELLAQPGVSALRHLRLKLGGSHVAGGLRATLRQAVTPHLQCGYGTTETGAVAFTEPADDAGETVGRALPGIEIQIRGAQGGPLPPGEAGEIAIRAAGLFRGYLDASGDIASGLQDGWFATGDVGRLDADGRLTVSGPCDDMFVFNSMNISPQELESLLCEHPDVSDAVVLPKASAAHGDIPVALVVWRPGSAPDLAALRAFMRPRAGLRSPRHYSLIDKIPRNAAGKILRAEARALIA